MIAFPCRFGFFANSKVHLAVCGSVAAYKAIELMRILQSLDIHVSVSLTEASTKFISPLTFSSLGASPVYGTMFGGEPFEHLEPGTFADSFALVPASANTMAKIAYGMADNTVSSQALSFPRPLVIFPAMNPKMWNNPATTRNTQLLQSLGHEVVMPTSGKVACGDDGLGKLPSVSDIALFILRDIVASKGQNILAGKKVLVTLGPTREAFDDVRIWTNYSTGYMGAAIAYACWLMGAEVNAIVGPGTPLMPPCCHTVNCITAKDMLLAAESLWDTVDLGFFTAAVADFSPVHYAGKYKKENEEPLAVTFTRNTDILASLGKRKLHQKILGFAAESSSLEENTQAKLLKKNADIMVGNLISSDSSSFASPDNTVYIYRSNKTSEHLATMSKENLAWRLVQELCDI